MAYLKEQGFQAIAFKDLEKYLPSVPPHESMQTLSDHEDGNSQTRLLKQEFLEGIEEARRFRRLHRLIREPGYNEYSSQVILRKLPRFLLGEIALIVSQVPSEKRRALCLRDLFFQSHSAEQVRHALPDRKPRVAIVCPSPASC